MPTQNRITRDIPSVLAADRPLQTKPAPAIKPVKSVRRSRAIKVLPTSPSLAPLDEPEAMDLMDNYRAQIAHCDRLKREMDAIQSAIFQTKREIASLHKSGFDTGDAIDVHGELDAIVGGTEQATQTILAAAEAIETANAAINDAATTAQRQVLSARIGDNITAIFEACNFQDLTGQRIGKVMATMGAIESHISTMMEIWGGVAAIKACAPEATERDADQRLLNGPKLRHSDEYVSQNDIDAMFD